jgi:hypothetical protein
MAVTIEITKKKNYHDPYEDPEGVTVYVASAMGRGCGGSSAVEARLRLLRTLYEDEMINTLELVERIMGDEMIRPW